GTSAAFALQVLPSLHPRVKALDQTSLLAQDCIQVLLINRTSAFFGSWGYQSAMAVPAVSSQASRVLRIGLQPIRNEGQVHHSLVIVVTFSNRYSYQLTG